MALPEAALRTMALLLEQDESTLSPLTLKLLEAVLLSMGAEVKVDRRRGRRAAAKDRADANPDRP